MLYITLREGDYFMVGENIRIIYERSEGKDQMHIGIDAPRNVQVLRGQVYESQIANQAAEGNPEAQALQTKLLEEYANRARKYNTRRASRAEHERRIQAGEIRPSNLPLDEDDQTARKIQRIINGQKKLAVNK